MDGNSLSWWQRWGNPTNQKTNFIYSPNAYGYVYVWKIIFYNFFFYKLDNVFVNKIKIGYFFYFLIKIK